MIEYAINDLIQHLNRQPPAIMHETSNVSASSGKSATGLERELGRFASAVDQWIQGLDSDVKNIWNAFESASVEERNIDQLTRVIDDFEKTFEASATDYRRCVKRQRKLLGIYRDTPVSYRTYASNLSKKWLANLARWEAAKAESLLSIRALRAKYASDAASGPIFDDHKSLGDYLRAATA